MTIYSTHPNRGKTQVLASYRTPNDDITSTTVTSCDDPILARTVVDALNRISACATLPLCVYDRRGNSSSHYPAGHLDTLSDPTARAGLLVGTHSLWYELVMFELHTAFSDLDQALHDTPAPVQLAITQELQAEARDLRAELLNYSENVEPTTPVQRSWQRSFPFVAHEGGMPQLDTSTRESLDRLEEGATTAALAEGVEGLRALLSAYRLTDNQGAMLDVSALSILDDPSWGPAYYLSIDSPVPGGTHPRGWSVYLGRWELDDPDDEDSGDSTGSAVVVCDLPTAPSAADLVQLLNLSAAGTSQHEVWATTPVGDPLTGTGFIVTSRYDSHK
ncbi:hypothetical protein [Micromonospora carbonacea]|uniref:Uncharacterized protein n=1 Tax=Micromonospora carbonacea TaxID=47853 RepID=A0A7H8XF48_9ACTN|nr:hypothetical protein [Micromonospora carbonacea]MBB5829056.1 hypothetical protein [Micromonospora carbonacea]QLD23435.1 hypothetical protein HXZ27_03720 [Micromonospora carbonacea]